MNNSMEEEIDISGLDKAAVLAALYNSAHPQGMGFLHYDPTPMTTEDASTYLEVGDDLTQWFGSQGSKRLYFDYLKGRVMKVDISGDTLDTWGYDRDNGQGAAKRAIDAIR